MVKNYLGRRGTGLRQKDDGGAVDDLGGNGSRLSEKNDRCRSYTPLENALWDVPAARDEGVLRSFLQPADKTFPMVATQDVGRLAAALLRSQSTQNPLPRIRMLDGFNEGWIEFSDHGRSAMKGTTALESVIAEVVRAS
jgi:hypothetical protein